MIPKLSNNWFADTSTIALLRQRNHIRGPESAKATIVVEERLKQGKTAKVIACVIGPR